MTARDVLFAFIGFNIAALSGLLVLVYQYSSSSDEAMKAQIVAMQKQLQAAQTKAAEEKAAFERVRAAEEAARRSGDFAQQKALAEARARAEADMKKLAEAASAANRAQQDAAKKEAEAKTQQDKLARAEADKKKAESAKAADAQRAAKERESAEKVAAAERAAAERIAAAEKAAKDAAERAAAAEKAARQKIGSAGSASGAATTGEQLFEQAAQLEIDGRGQEAVRAYTRAARSGSGKAAKRLGEIYDKGIPGVSRDYAESLKWYNTARALGEDLKEARRPGGESPSIEPRAPRTPAPPRPSPEYYYERGLARETAGDNVASLAFYRRAAREGSLEAAQRLCGIYEKGIPGVLANPKASAFWCEFAEKLNGRSSRRSSQDDDTYLRATADTMERAWQLESAGKGAEAVELYRLAVGAGDGKAARRLSEVYFMGIPGVPRDYAEHLKWQNVARALGEDIPDNRRLNAPASPDPLHRTSAEDSFAQAVMLEMEGRFADAARQYRLAARHGHAAAARKLGEIYGKGMPGVELDYGESLKWLNTARVLGEEPAPAR